MHQDKTTWKVIPEMLSLVFHKKEYTLNWILLNGSLRHWQRTEKETIPEKETGRHRSGDY